MEYKTPKNSGTLWLNDYKTEDKHPDFRGHVLVERGFLNLLMEKHSDQDGRVKLSVACWKKVGKGKELISIIISEPYITKPKPVEPIPAPPEDEDVPF